MAVRTTAGAVEAICEVEPTISLTPFIETANSVVTRVCVKTPTSYTSVELELIERWLSAHFYCTRDPKTIFEMAGAVAARYEGKVDLNLNNTRYGQQAMLIDTEGGLAALNREVGRKGVGRVRVNWVGTDSDEDDEE